MDTGRWTIVARATPRVRRPSDPQKLRARVHVRCVCGVERTVWLDDVQQARSTGCESRRCLARYLASRDMREALASFIAAEQEALRASVAELNSTERAEEVARSFSVRASARAECLIAEYLRARVYAPSEDEVSQLIARR